jgi:uncharacterized protein
MYKRLLNKAKGSFMLFGPRGTGKSTWLASHCGDAVRYDLLDSHEALRLEREPHQLFHELCGLESGRWVVLDEVQRVPALLNEVHRLIEQRGLRFVLCGSSARKLRRSGVNLLAGRAVVKQMFPLTSAELGGDFDMSQACMTGTMPLALDAEGAHDFLAAYAASYLNEEIRAEALTRNVGAFSRFLEVAARQNAQGTNFSNIARESAVAQSTVRNYFDILVDTLIGYWVEPWKMKKSTRQVGQPKFYFFDTGVARVLTGRLPYPPSQEEFGPLFETLIMNEVRAFIEYNGLHYKVGYWRTYDGAEVDVFCETQEGFTAIEIKAASSWQRRFNRGLQRVRQDMAPRPVKMFGVFPGGRSALLDEVRVMPACAFLKALWNGEVIS